MLEKIVEFGLLRLLKAVEEDVNEFVCLGAFSREPGEIVMRGLYRSGEELLVGGDELDERSGGEVETHINALSHDSGQARLRPTVKF